MWLLEANARKIMERAATTGFMPTAEQQMQMEAMFSSESSSSGSRILSIAGNSAEINISGILTNTQDFLAIMFGGGNTTYPEIISAIALAEKDDTVEDVTFAIGSPGGSTEGLFDTMSAIASMKKPTKAIVSNLAASAAYGLASQTGRIVATNRAARFGSIGIVAMFSVDEDEVTISSTDAPKKRPDVTTEAGVAVVREELDALHDLFAETIADGRGVTTEEVNAEFGQGATLLADEALRLGMIDDITGRNIEQTNVTDKGVNQNKETAMDMNTLRAQHPETYAAAIQAGVTQERDRVSAHLIMGEQSGAMETASAAIRDGSEMTATLQATYLTAGMNRQDIKDKQTDDATAAAAAAATAAAPTPDTDAEKVAAAIEHAMGTDVGGAQS